METSGVPGTSNGPFEQASTAEPPDLAALLDEIEAELAVRPAVPVGDRVAIDPTRMKTLTNRLRDALTYARGHPLDDTTYQARIQQAEAAAVLLTVEATHKAQMLLDGERVKKLRQEQIAAVVDESRQRGEVRVAEAYTYADARMREVLGRAEEAHRAVRTAYEAVHIPGPSAGKRLVVAARQLMNRRRSERLASMLARLFRR